MCMNCGPLDEPHYTRLGDSDFHELQLHDPAGVNIALLEARTFSPPRRDHPGSGCGWFSSYSLPALDTEAVGPTGKTPGLSRWTCPMIPWRRSHSPATR